MAQRTVKRSTAPPRAKTHHSARCLVRHIAGKSKPAQLAQIVPNELQHTDPAATPVGLLNKDEFPEL